MTSQFNHLNLFATPVSVVRPSPKFTDHLQNLSELVMRLKSEVTGQEPKSLKGEGWRLDNPHNIDGFNILSEYLRWLIKNYLQFYKMPVDSKYVLTSWINLHGLGGYNSAHHHNPALVSGVIYISVPIGAGKLIIKDPRQALSYVSRFTPPLSSTFDANNPLCPQDSFEIKPIPGLAVIFPGWLEHSVQPNTSEENPRISVAFNLFEAKDAIISS